ncbi:MAG: CsbD family protein [Thermostichus sp. DG_1_6_bins_120]
MNLEEQAGATAQNLEGKIQEAVGELAGDQREKLEGKAKPAEVVARQVVEDTREAIKDVVDDVMD